MNFIGSREVVPFLMRDSGPRPNSIMNGRAVISIITASMIVMASNSGGLSGKIASSLVAIVLLSGSLRRTGTSRDTQHSSVTRRRGIELSRTGVVVAATAHVALFVLVVPNSTNFARDFGGLALAYGSVLLTAIDIDRKPRSRRNVLERKRAFDLVLALLLTPVIIAAILPLAALIVIFDRRFPFYRQTRLGRFRKPFRLVKLRTMTDDSLDPQRPRWTAVDDQRVTPMGRILRRLHLDELPQIWNVLCGDLSFVGPRPERPEFAEVFAGHLPKYQSRHSVPTGITGLAQVEGFAGNSSLRRRLRCDLFYVRHVSMCFDLRIILLTIISTIKSNRRKQYNYDPDRDDTIP